MFSDVFEDLKRQNRVETTDPRHISELDVEAFLIWMRQRNIKNVSKKKYLSLLDSYFGFFGNHIISDMRRQNKLNLPTKSQEEDVSYIEEADLKKIFDHIRDYPGYHGIVIRGFFSLIFGVVGRPKEIINGLIEDVDLENEQFYIRHPKGEGSWGKPEWIPIIRGDMIPFIERFLKERAEYLAFHDIDSNFLFPNPDAGRPYVPNTIRKIKSEIEEETGVDFKLKDFRSTYATLTYKHAPEMKEAIRNRCVMIIPRPQINITSATIITKLRNA